MNNKHTQAFNNQFYGELKEPTFVEAENFVNSLSEELSEKIVSKIVSRTGKTWTDNKAIYIYCKENNIESDVDTFQTELLFEQKTAKDLVLMDDIYIDGNEAIVLENNKESERLTVQFIDDQEIEVVDYGKVKMQL
jgi:hypothetical protein